MARDLRAQAALALHRFAFAPKPGALALVNDARAALIAELEDPAAGQIKRGNLLSSGEAARAAFEFRQERQRLAARAPDEACKHQAKEAQENASQPEMTQPQAQQAEPGPNPGPGLPQQIYLEEAKARLDSALDANFGFVERLIWFWSNHFCVSADKGGVRPLCSAYEREAIRPHVRGKFADMLLAVESHPAMLLYLDNARSIGPRRLLGYAATRALTKTLRVRFSNCIRSVCAPAIHRTTSPVSPR